MIFIPLKGDFAIQNFFYTNSLLNFVYENDNTIRQYAKSNSSHSKKQNTKNPKQNENRNSIKPYCRQR